MESISGEDRGLPDGVDPASTAAGIDGREAGPYLGPMALLPIITAPDPRLKVNLPDLKKPVFNLSGGQRQCIAISRAIYFKAKVLIMDEPTAALGPQETQQVNELIASLKQEGVGIFLISHDLHDVFDLADRVSVMKNGRVVGSALTSEITQDEVLEMIIAGKVPRGSPAPT